MARLEYKRRRPERTVLYETVRRHLATFRAQVDAADRTLPRFVEREFEKYLTCGILAHGFVRTRCESCKFERLVAFSCKSRGWCPSCIGRRMAQTAAYLSDEILQDVPTRTWTLTVPHPLRYLMAYNPDVLGEVIAAYTKCLMAWQRHRAKKILDLDTVRQAHPAMVTWVQRFGSAANLNVHFHSLAMEGVWVETVDGATWHTLPSPSSGDIAGIAWDICRRVTRALQRRGEYAGLAADQDDELAQREPLLAACYAASIRGFVATGRRAGQPIIQMGVPTADHDSSGVLPPAHGFSLYAGRCISAFDRTRREHAIRYMARPPLPDSRLSFTSGGDVRLQLKTPWRNGTTHIQLTGPELIERLVSLVPRPRVNLVRYHGALAPNARIRPHVIRHTTTYLSEPQPSVPVGCRYHDWATLMARVFEIDVTLCPRCGTRGMQVIAAIIKGETIRKILAHIGESTAPPRLEPARFTDQDWCTAA